MNDSVKKYLPLGTVVLLKNASKRMMITGFCCASKEDHTKIYDYAGCIFPEGLISTDQAGLFNHDQIDKIYYFGLIDEEQKEFTKKLLDFVSSNDLTKLFEKKENDVPVSDATNGESLNTNLQS